MDHANQITLRFWSNEAASVEERIENADCVTTPQERTDLQTLLVNHVRALKTRVAALERGSHSQRKYGTVCEMVDG